MSGPEDRHQRLYAAMARHDGHLAPMPRLRAICAVGLELLSMNGVGVMLMAEGVHQGTLYATDEMINHLEDLQNAAGEGPCFDSYNLGRPVLAPDLAVDAIGRWPLLATAALGAGIKALFSFPLQIDDASFGALNLYRDRPGPLTEEEVDDARLLAAMATREVLALQAVGVPGSLPAVIADLFGDRAVIEQATGMIAAQLDADIMTAARRLRDAAEQDDRPLADLAHDVVERRRRLD